MIKKKKIKFKEKKKKMFMSWEEVIVRPDPKPYWSPICQPPLTSQYLWKEKVKCFR